MGLICKLISRIIAFIKRFLPLLLNSWMWCDMLFDAFTTKIYWDYGNDPTNFDLIVNIAALNSTNVTSSTPNNSTSNSTDPFIFFYIAMVIWALSPFYYTAFLFIHLLRCMFITTEQYEEIFQKMAKAPLTFFNITSNELKKSKRAKFIFTLILLFYIILFLIFSPFFAYVMIPICSIIIAWKGAKLPCFNFVKGKNTSNITFLGFNEKDVAHFKFWEASLEALGQLLLAVVFFLKNKEFFRTRNSFPPGVSEGDTLITSIGFSLGSLIFTWVSHFYNRFTIRYGNDVYKQICCKSLLLIGLFHHFRLIFFTFTFPIFIIVVCSLLIFL